MTGCVVYKPGTLLADARICMRISRRVLLGMRNVSVKVVEKNRTHILLFNYA